MTGRRVFLCRLGVAAGGALLVTRRPQRGTVANLAAQGPMYDNLVRRDPRDGQTIIPDLAWKWDVSPDGRRYTFHLRRGVHSTTAPT
jgi:ABC-type transport system substrate-binding protein